MSFRCDWTKFFSKFCSFVGSDFLITLKSNNIYFYLQLEKHLSFEYVIFHTNNIVFTIKLMAGSRNTSIFFFKKNKVWINLKGVPYDKI